MSFTRIADQDFNGKGARSLPDQPTISASELKRVFDEDAREVVAPKVNTIVGELEATSAAASLGATAPSGRTGNTVQAVMNSISSGVDAKSTITLSNVITSGVRIATVIIDGASTDLKAPQGGQGTMDYDDLTDKPQINSNTLSGNKSSSDLGLASASHTHSASDITSGLATVATTGAYSDLSGKPSIPTVTDIYSETSSDAMSGKAVKSAIDALDGTITGSPSTSKTLSAFSQTDGKVSATFADISITKSQVSDLGTIPADLDDLSDVTLSSPTNGQVLAYDYSTSKWKNQNASGGSADAYKTIDAAGTSFVASGADTFKINAGSNVTITALSSPDKGIQISASGGGQSTGDMLMSDYDSQGDVKTAGGIESYVATAISGKQDTISSGNGINVSSNTVSVDFGTVASGTTTKPPTGKAVYDAIAALDATITGSPAASKTVTAFSETDGKVSATFADISITKSQVSDFPAIPTVTDIYSDTSSDAMSGKAVKQAIDALDVTTSGAAASKTITALSQTDGKISATFGNISITKSQVSDFPTIPANLNDLSDVTVSSPSNDQVLKYNGSGWVNGAAPASGHTMLPTPAAGVDEDDVVDAINTGLLEGGANDDVASLYGVGSWSNTDCIQLMAEVDQGDDGLGAWNDNWKTDGIRTGWIWDESLYRILEDGSGNRRYDIHVEPVFDIGDEETVSLYAWRIDDNYTNGGTPGGCVAFKFNGEIQSAHAYVGIKITKLRTKYKVVTPLS